VHAKAQNNISWDSRFRDLWL